MAHAVVAHTPGATVVHSVTPGLSMAHVVVAHTPRAAVRHAAIPGLSVAHVVVTHTPGAAVVHSMTPGATGNSGNANDGKNENLSHNKFLN